MNEQPEVPIIPYEYASKVALVLGALGQLFVITSTWQLGITGTFLGDYFGILMDHRVTGYVVLSEIRLGGLRELTRCPSQVPFQCSQRPHVCWKHHELYCHFSMVRP
jgi:Phospholipid methyltransferase